MDQSESFIELNGPMRTRDNARVCSKSDIVWKYKVLIQYTLNINRLYNI